MSAEPPPSLVSALTFVGRETAAFKSLPGFQKGRHTLPSAVTPATTAFLAKLCAEPLAAAAEAFFQSTRAALGYKRREISLAVASPAAVLTTPDFSFELAYALEPDDPARYSLTSSLRALSRAELVRRPEFDELCAGRFTDLVFSLRGGVRVEAVIDAIEALAPDAGLTVAYPSDYHDCTIALAGEETVIRCTGATLELQLASAGSPAALLDAFAAVRATFARQAGLEDLLG